MGCSAFSALLVGKLPMTGMATGRPCVLLNSPLGRRDSGKRDGMRDGSPDTEATAEELRNIEDAEKLAEDS